MKNPTKAPPPCLECGHPSTGHLYFHSQVVGLSGFLCETCREDDVEDVWRPPCAFCRGTGDDHFDGPCEWCDGTGCE